MSSYTWYGLLAILLWSSTVGLARSLSEAVGPMAAGAAVYLGGGAGSLLWRLLRGEAPFSEAARLPRRYVLGCGGLFTAYMALFYAAIGLAEDRSQVLVVGLANYLWPALILLLSIPILGKRPGPWFIPGTLLAVAGVAAVMLSGAPGASGASALAAADPLACGLALAGAALWGLYSNLAARWAGRESGGAVVFFMLASGAVLALLAAFWPGGGPCGARQALEAAGLGAATALGYELWDSAARKGDLTLAAAASYFTPLLSTAFSCAYLGVLPGPGLWAGCGLLVAGSFMSWRSLR